MDPRTITTPRGDKNSRHRVCAELEAMIADGTLRPGQKLPQQQLAKQFGVALGVLRESLLELKATGLVEVIDNVGMFVAELDERRVLEAFEIREVHAGLAARLCCQRASRENLRELRAMVEEVYSLGQQGKTELAAMLDRRFHRRIVEIAGNQTLERLTDSFRVLTLVLGMSDDVAVVHAAHTAIVNAIEENRPDEAERLMRSHVRSAHTIIEEQIRAGTFSPQWVK